MEVWFFMFKHQILAGSHFQGGVRYFSNSKNDIIEGDVDLCELFPGRFRLIEDTPEQEESNGEDSSIVDGGDVSSGVAVPIVDNNGKGVKLGDKDTLVGDTFFMRRVKFGRYDVFNVKTGTKCNKKSFANESVALDWIAEQESHNV
jgi:hypothetical protein